MAHLDQLEDCRLCPRRCGVNRASGGRGFCGAGNRVEVFTCGPHHGEEPPISGTAGSGTVFFSRCTLRCIYCQNYRFSQLGEGREYDTAGLVEMLRLLREKDCHNWNFVSPTPWLPFIRDAVGELKSDGVFLPIVYNTSGFENVETIAGLDGFVNVYLTDLRYACEETARVASQFGGYAQIAREALREMWRQAGTLKLDGNGIAQSGTICRLLVLPGHAQEAVDNLKWLAANIGTEIAVSVMAQYTPAHKAVGSGDWGRGITRAEYDSVRDVVEDLGFENGWVQEFGEAPDRELVGFNMEPRSTGAPGRKKC